MSESKMQQYIQLAPKRVLKNQTQIWDNENATSYHSTASRVKG
jgi:hypothetical protein